MRWTRSCLRLLDFLCTKEDDYDHWRQHDLDRGHFNEEQKAYFENNAVWLCARCEDVGARNGRKLARLAESQKVMIHRITSQHSRKSGSTQRSAAFEGLRSVVRLARGCKVILVRNVAYLFELANGTRGTLVGVVYGPGGIGTFPEALILDVPDDIVPVFYIGEPTLVPILPLTAVKEEMRMTRI